MEIIDSHLHIGKWKIPMYFGLENSVKQTDSALKACNISGAVAMPSDELKNAQLLKELRDNAQLKYWFFPWINPKDKNIMKFLETNLDFISGLKFHGSLCKCKITNPAYKKFLVFAERNSLPVLAHAGRWQKMASYKYVIELAWKWPGIDFIMAHQGGDSPELKVNAALEIRKAKLQNIWLDVSATREFWTIPMGIKEIGASRFLFGSDYPVVHPSAGIAMIDSLRLDKKDTEKILGKNIFNIINRRKYIGGMKK